MKKYLIALLMSILALELQAGIVVFPFKVLPAKHRGHQWLGKAVSYTLTMGLKENGIPSVSHMKVDAWLEFRNINFPFHITKASAIKLARETGAESLIWGEIFTDKAGDDAVLEVRSFIINLKNYSQKYLPLLKCDLSGLYDIQKVLLNNVLRHLGQTGFNVVYPQLNMPYQGYEFFIKSLLLKDRKKKKELLEKGYNLTEHSDYLNFELARTYYETQELARAGAILKKIENEGIFTDGKKFLQALIYYREGKPGQAALTFKELRNTSRFYAEASNNLGIILFGSHRLTEAEECLVQSLNAKKDPDVFTNYIKILLATGKNDQAVDRLTEALRWFPEEENLLEYFAYFISAEPETVYRVFANYLPDLVQTRQMPALPLIMISPFDYSFPEPETWSGSEPQVMETIEENGDRVQIEQIEDSLSLNPFVAGFHFRLGNDYFKKKQWLKAEMYALSAIFLEKKEEYYLLLINIYKSIGKKDKISRLKASVYRRFPESQQLKKALHKY